MILVSFFLACLRYPTEDYRVDEINLYYYVSAEDLEEATVHVRLRLDHSPYMDDMILSDEDSLYVEHDGGSYVLDEEDSTKLILTDVLYTKTIPYSDLTKPFTLVFDRPSGQYRTDVYLSDDFSVSVQNDEPFAFSSDEYIPVDVRWTSIQNASELWISVRDTDCAGYSSISPVENTGQAQIDICLYEPFEQVGLTDLFCPVKVYVSAQTRGYATDFQDSYVRGYQRRFSLLKVLYIP